MFGSFQIILCSSLNQVFTYFDFSHRNKDSQCHLQVLFGSELKLGSPGYLVELEDMVANSCWRHSLAVIRGSLKSPVAMSVSRVQATPPFAGR